MGGHVCRLAAGQRSQLTVLRAVVLALLAVDGVLSAIAGAMFLPSYIGAVPFPLSALASGLLNVALVWAAGRWTSRNSLAALPVWTFLLTVVVMAFPGPGGDVIFAGRGIAEYSPFLLLAAGTALPLWVLLRRRPAP